MTALLGLANRGEHPLHREGQVPRDQITQPVGVTKLPYQSPPRVLASEVDQVGELRRVDGCWRHRLVGEVEQDHLAALVCLLDLLDRARLGPSCRSPDATPENCDEQVTVT